jgi:hypothetical protein
MSVPATGTGATGATTGADSGLCHLVRLHLQLLAMPDAENGELFSHLALLGRCVGSQTVSL